MDSERELTGRLFIVSVAISLDVSYSVMTSDTPADIRLRMSRNALEANPVTNAPFRRINIGMK